MSHSVLLAKIALFEGLSEEDLNALSESLAERRFPAGTIVMNRGDSGTSMFIVAQGDVNIYLPGEASRRVSLKDISAGEYFGELALFDDKPRSASALASTDALLLELSRDTLSTYLSQRSNAAMALLRTVAGRLRETNEMLSQRAAKNVVAEMEAQLTWSEKLADKVAELNGSWTFIILVLGLTLCWVGLNSIGCSLRKFDPYPYVFFNLLLAILVSLQGPLIVMSQNRSTLKDRAQAETDFKVRIGNATRQEKSRVDRIPRSTQLPAPLTPVMPPGSPREAPRWLRVRAAARRGRVVLGRDRRSVAGAAGHRDGAVAELRGDPAARPPQARAEQSGPIAYRRGFTGIAPDTPAHDAPWTRAAATRGLR